MVEMGLQAEGPDVVFHSAPHSRFNTVIEWAGQSTLKSRSPDVIGQDIEDGKCFDALCNAVRFQATRLYNLLRIYIEIRPKIASSMLE